MAETAQTNPASKPPVDIQNLAVKEWMVNESWAKMCHGPFRYDGERRKREIKARTEELKLLNPQELLRLDKQADDWQRAFGPLYY
jgi:hypothetical protein